MIVNSYTSCSGFHKPQKECDATEVIRKVRQVLSEERKHLFPNIVSVESLARSDDMPRGNGGWADLRDQLLCKKMSMPIQISYEDLLMEIRNRTRTGELRSVK